MVFIVNCSIYLIWKLILNADFSVFPTGRTGFDYGLFRLLNLDTLYWLLILAFEMGLTASVTGCQGVLTTTWSHLYYIHGSVFTQFLVFGKGAPSGCDLSTRDALGTWSTPPDPTSNVSKGPCQPELYCKLFHLFHLETDFDSDFSVYMTDFDCILFCLPNLDIWYWLMIFGRISQSASGL